MSDQDYYKILGVSRSASEDQIKSAYRRLARKYHPDVNKAPDAAERFKEATEAYEVLTDPQKRKVYDQFGKEGLSGAGGGGQRVYSWGPRPGAGTGAGRVGFEDFFGRGGGPDFMRMSLDEILSALGGGARRWRPRGRARPQRGGDREYPITLDFLQAVRGATVTLRLQRNEPSGRQRTETLNVKIPPGVREGSRIRVRGKGDQAPGGSGDLYIVAHVREHPYFRRVGDDIYVDLPIGLSEAALGAKVDVPTTDGMMTVTVPPGSRSGRRLRVRGKGVAGPGGRSRGDQYVVLQIVPPEKVSQKGRQLLEQFAETEAYDPRAKVPWKTTS